MSCWIGEIDAGASRDAAAPNPMLVELCKEEEGSVL